MGQCIGYYYQAGIGFGRQFRYGSRVSLEPPGGVIEKGEDPIEAGLRELKEETAMLVRMQP